MTDKRDVSRRKFIAGAAALSGLAMAGCDAERYLPPKIRGGVIGATDVLTMASQRLLMAGQPLAQEHERSDISENHPTWGQTNPEDEDFQRLLAGDFAEWSIPVGGLVHSQVSLSLTDLKQLESRTQVTMHICEQGWSAIAEWTGARLRAVLEAAGGVTAAARYVAIDTYDGWYEGYDMFDVVHPQTLLAYGMNGEDLPLGNGAPVRLRVERASGYKNLKFLKSITVVASMDEHGEGTGGVNSDYNWHWYSGA